MECSSLTVSGEPGEALNYDQKNNYSCRVGIEKYTSSQPMEIWSYCYWKLNYQRAWTWETYAVSATVVSGNLHRTNGEYSKAKISPIPSAHNLTVRRRGCSLSLLCKLNMQHWSTRGKVQNGDTNSTTEDLALRWEPPTASQWLPCSDSSVTGINLVVKTGIWDRIPLSRSRWKATAENHVFALGFQTMDPEMPKEFGAFIATSS